MGMLGGARARCAIEKAPQCESLGGARARCRPGRTRKLAILAPADAHDERRRVRHGGGTGVDLELHDPAYWPTGLLAYIDVLAYWPTGWWSGLVRRERPGGEWVAWFDSAPHIGVLSVVCAPTLARQKREDTQVTAAEAPCW